MLRWITAHTSPLFRWTFLAELLTTLLICALVISHTGCASQRALINEVNAAPSETRVIVGAGAALYEFTILQNAANLIGADRAVNLDVRETLLKASVAAKPAADDLDRALRAVYEAQATLPPDSPQTVRRLRELSSLAAVFGPRLAALRKARNAARP